VTSTCWLVDCIELKTDRMSNKVLHTQSAAKYKHHNTGEYGILLNMQVRKIEDGETDRNHPICHKVE
jgi:hypothetical protein